MIFLGKSANFDYFCSLRSQKIENSGRIWDFKKVL